MVQKSEELSAVLGEVKNVDLEINKLLVPILQDTIADGNRHNKRMFTINIIALFIILAVSITSLFLVYRQNIKYQEFLNQFDFGEETVYQDLDTNQGGDINNPIINNK